MKIAFYISGHGFGHASRMAALAKTFTTFGIDVVLCTDRPLHLFSHLPDDLTYFRAVAIDFGVIHKENLVADLEATKAALFELFSRREQIVAEEVSFLRREKIDLVICDIPFFIIESCAYAEIPIFGVSNFDWAYIYEHIFDGDPDTLPLVNVIRSLYRRMDRSYLLDLGSLETVPGFRDPQKGGMLAKTLSMPTDIRAKYGINESAAILLISFGGEGILDLDLPKICAAWDGVVLCGFPSPEIPKLIKISPDDDYLSVIHAADLIICKPGYSTFAEIMSMGKRMIYLPRRNYPEEQVLIAGIKDYSAALQVDQMPNDPDQIRELFEIVPYAQSSVEVSNTRLAASILADYLSIKYPEERLISVFDLGSNNMNYILFNKTRDHILHRAWCTTALGRDFDGSRLSEESIQRAFDEISRIMSMDSRVSSQKELIATGINRKAENSDQLLKMLREKWQVKTKIITANREFRLSWLASDKAGVDPFRKIVIDIGGASTELSYLDQNKALRGISFDFGLQSLMRDFSSVDEAVASVHDAFDALPDKEKPKIIAVGLTATILGRILGGLPYNELLSIDFMTFSREQMLSFINAAKIDQLHGYEGLFEDRYEQDSIYLASLLIKLLLDRYGSHNFMVCNDGISMGYAKWIK
jgi:hypothetical protein